MRRSLPLANSWLHPLTPGLRTVWHWKLITQWISGIIRKALSSNNENQNPDGWSLTLTCRVSGIYRGILYKCLRSRTFIKWCNDLIWNAVHHVASLGLFFKRVWNSFYSTSERKQLIKQPHFIAENHENFILHPQTNRTLSLRDNHFYFEAQVV